MNPLDDASLGRLVPWSKCPLDDASLEDNIPDRYVLTMYRIKVFVLTSQFRLGYVAYEHLNQPDAT